MANCKSFLIEDPIYGFSVNLFVGTWRQYRTFIRRKLGKKTKVGKHGAKSEGHTDTFQNDVTGEERIFIRLSRWHGRTTDINTLAHELIHHAFFTLNAVGVTVDPSDKNEAFAYYYGMLIEKCFECLYDKENTLHIGPR